STDPPTTELYSLSLHDALPILGYHDEDENINIEGLPTSNLKQSGFVFRQSYTRGTDIGLDPKARVIQTRDAKQGLREFCQIEGRDRKSTRLNSSHVESSYAVFC